MAKSILLSVALTLTACGSTLNDVATSKQRSEGTSQVYAVAPAQAWIIAHNVLRDLHVDPIEDHQAEGYMLTSAPGDGIVGGGCFIGVWIESTPPAPYARVTIVTKRRGSLSMTTGLTESTFQRNFAQAVAMAPPAGVFVPAAQVQR